MKVQICHEQQQRDRIVNRCKGPDMNSTEQSYASMMNPLLKTQIKNLSADTSAAFKAMSGELAALKNSLDKCDLQLGKINDMGKELAKVAASANAE